MVQSAKYEILTYNLVSLIVFVCITKGCSLLWEKEENKKDNGSRFGAH
jgi:hypothetical protein